MLYIHFNQTFMKNLFTILLCCICIIIGSCTDLDEVNSRLDTLEKTVFDMQSAVQALDQAYKEGKIIKDVKALEGDTGGWTVYFSDNSSINIVNGTNGVDGKNGIDGKTPYLKVDQDGYLTVSYDNGETFTRLKDENGNDIYVNSKSVRVITNDNGYYVFVEYDTNDTTRTIREIETPLSSNASMTISGIAENDILHIITITMADGTVFTFSKEYFCPTSIAILTTQCVNVSKGIAATVEFRVNPQSALFNYDTSSDSCQIQLDKVGTAQINYAPSASANKLARVSSTDISYVTKPTAYQLTKVEQCYDEQGVLKKGQYKATIEDTGTGTDYNDLVTFVISTTDGSGNQLLVSSSAFQLKYNNNVFTSFSLKEKNNSPAVLKDVEATMSGNNITISSPYITDVSHLCPSFTTNGTVYVGNTTQRSGVSEQDFTNPVTYKVVADNGEITYYTVTIKYSGLPVMEITTPSGVAITSKDDWIKNSEYKIINTDGTIDNKGTLAIKGRGNSTWTYPKKPYAIKLDSKTELLGLPYEKRFDLLANWMDRTLLRNDVSFHIANLTRTMGWNPAGRFVEVILNGKHIGNYYLCEHIKVSENRVNITEIDEDVTSGDLLSGGYIMELDINYDEAYKFMSTRQSLPYMFKDPDEVNDAQFNYMKQYVDQLETALYDKTKFQAREFVNYMDLDSYIDWWFVHELTGNAEPNWPKSCYMHKDVNGKMIAGPVWDFDYGTYQYENCWEIMGSLYYGQLFNDATFKARIKEKWNLQKRLYEAVDTYIASQADRIKHSDELNISLWPISSRENGDETLSFSDAIKRMRNNYADRIKWMNAQISGF